MRKKVCARDDTLRKQTLAMGERSLVCDKCALFSSITAIFRFVYQPSALTPSPVGSTKENVGEEKGDVGERSQSAATNLAMNPCKKLKFRFTACTGSEKKRHRRVQRLNYRRTTLPVISYLCSLLTYKKTQARRPKHSKLKQAEGRE